MAQAISPMSVIVSEDCESAAVKGKPGTKVRRGSSLNISYQHGDNYYGVLETGEKVWIKKDKIQVAESNSELDCFPVHGEILFKFDHKTQKVAKGISVQKGDKVTVLASKGGWLFGYKAGCQEAKGVFPKNFFRSTSIVESKSDDSDSSSEEESSSSESEAYESEDLDLEDSTTEKETQNVHNMNVSLTYFCEEAIRNCSTMDITAKNVLLNFKSHCSRSFARIMLQEMFQIRATEKLRQQTMQEKFNTQIQIEHGILLDEIDKLSNSDAVKSTFNHVKKLESELCKKDEIIETLQLNVKALDSKLVHAENKEWLETELSFIKPPKYL